MAIFVALLVAFGTMVAVAARLHDAHGQKASQSPDMDSVVLSSQNSKGPMKHSTPAHTSQRIGDSGGPVLARLRAAAVGSNESNSPARFGMSNHGDPVLSAAQVLALRRRYRGRKFLFPLLDQVHP